MQICALPALLAFLAELERPAFLLKVQLELDLLLSQAGTLPPRTSSSSGYTYNCRTFRSQSRQCPGRSLFFSEFHDEFSVSLIRLMQIKTPRRAVWRARGAPGAAGSSRERREEFWPVAATPSVGAPDAQQHPGSGGAGFRITAVARTCQL